MVSMYALIPSRMFLHEGSKIIAYPS